ncbi:DUF6435 family protein [Pseudobacteriovorax antillogorgiicola]|uniref:Lacal_2735 family protein n=1 Tax=Pseudobacteriovorax antillogorgiicola TaxID=1513793 RepID=A0A1Y6CE75_9BACT|nr:DUF6435 family protein [Pseudobacteriovorax antillogorgiicola]TCS47677.1 hypothetical protein EDD56_120118 [Pseudobacteriovorax antillogorgiicola]SMF59599.1 hypothetical protein SAMN06296036_12022 [Pseudobacteriovorax antillogorgiicola]
MFGFLKVDPEKKIKNQIQKLYEQAVLYQRNGKLREYSEVMAEIDSLERKLDREQLN